MEESLDNKKCSCNKSGESCNCKGEAKEQGKSCKSGCSCNDNVLKKARPEIISLLNTDFI